MLLPTNGTVWTLACVYATIEAVRFDRVRVHWAILHRPRVVPMFPVLPHVRPGHGWFARTHSRTGTKRSVPRSRPRVSPRGRTRTNVPCLVLGSALLFVGANLFVLYHMLTPSTERIRPSVVLKPERVSTSCSFRPYPSHRYYGLDRGDVPPFLAAPTPYVWGSWPIVLSDAEPTKLCMDQSAWQPHDTDTVPRWPFADGTNPSLLHVSRWPAAATLLPPSVRWLATTGMTHAQCVWNPKHTSRRTSRTDGDTSHTPPFWATQTEPDTVRTVLLLLDDQWRVQAQVTIGLERDAAWGRNYPARTQPNTRRDIFALDDARLFVHQEQLWISFREGQIFGYETQVLNRVYLTRTDDDNDATNDGLDGTSPTPWRATIRASETTSFCCGRNMALMEPRHEPHTLQSLTWIDPVTVVDVDTTPLVQRKKNDKGQGKPHRRLLEPLPDPFHTNTTSAQRRRTAVAATKTPPKSHIHGTNAFMVYWPAHDVYLGVGHFHRPHDRKPNSYARFGHHYTHVFYTLTASAPYRLGHVSPEWVLPAASPPHAHDAEIIQFASGLEVDPDGEHDIVVAYGINDCEAAVVRVAATTVWKLLRPVPEGQEIAHLMAPLDTTAGDA